jgi:hypothetical protein
MMTNKINSYNDKREFYEITVGNSDSIFKIDKTDYNIAKERIWVSEKHILNENTFEYLVNNNTDDDGKFIRIYYHIEIMKQYKEKYKYDNNYSKTIIVDHINGDTTDNRKKNLRVRTQSENNMNKTIQCNNKSGIVGVYWDKPTNMWISLIAVRKKRMQLGSFYYLRNAVKARIDAEKKYFGEHAFIKRDENYQKFIKQILDLPDKIEPVIWNIKYIENTDIYLVTLNCCMKKIKVLTRCKTEILAQNFVNKYMKSNPDNIYIEKSKKTPQNI